jgi:outer membrane protein assembly factor BamB
MQNVKVLQRRAAPAGRPQPLAFHRDRLWIGSWDTDRLYAVDPRTWVVVDEVPAPGKPYGIAVLGDEIVTVLGVGDDDDRYLYRFAPGRGFDTNPTPCPDFTGSHLAVHGETLYLCQQGNRQILALDAAGSVQREIPLKSRCAGLAFDSSGKSYIIAGDEEFENLELAAYDLRRDAPELAPVASVAFDARGLAFDGADWWTSHRDENEVVSFTL